MCREWGRWCQALGEKKSTLQVHKKSQEGFGLKETRDMVRFALEKDSSGGFVETRVGESGGSLQPGEGLCPLSSGLLDR